MQQAKIDDHSDFRSDEESEMSLNWDILETEIPAHLPFRSLLALGATCKHLLKTIDQKVTSLRFSGKCKFCNSTCQVLHRFPQLQILHVGAGLRNADFIYMPKLIELTLENGSDQISDEIFPLLPNLRKLVIDSRSHFVLPQKEGHWDYPRDTAFIREEALIEELPNLKQLFVISHENNFRLYYSVSKLLQCRPNLRVRRITPAHKF